VAVFGVLLLKLSPRHFSSARLLFFDQCAESDPNSLSAWWWRGSALVLGRSWLDWYFAQPAVLEVLVGAPKVTWLFIPIALLGRVDALVVGMQQLLALRTRQRQHSALDGIIAESSW
jgi:hypothetical protein